MSASLFITPAVKTNRLFLHLRCQSFR